MNTTFFCMLMILLTVFMFSWHPLTLITETMILTLMTSWFFSEMMINSWLSIILVLIWLGGLLIIFIYLSSMIPNEMIKISKKFLYILPIMLLMKPTINYTTLYYLKNIYLFSNMSYYMFIPMILMYMMIGLSVTIFMTSLLKTPNKQEMN